MAIRMKAGKLTDARFSLIVKSAGTKPYAAAALRERLDEIILFIREQTAPSEDQKLFNEAVELIASERSARRKIVRRKLKNVERHCERLIALLSDHEIRLEVHLATLEREGRGPTRSVVKLLNGLLRRTKVALLPHPPGITMEPWLETAMLAIADAYQYHFEDKEISKLPHSERSKFVGFLTEVLQQSGTQEYYEAHVAKQWQRLRAKMQPIF